MDNIRERYTLPSYYDSYLQDKTERIRALIRESGEDGDVFLFITDEHWSENRKNSLPLIQALAKELPIPRLFSGGDETDGHGGDFCRLIREVFPGKIYHAVGNHEYFLHTTGEELWADFDADNDDQIGNPQRHYYYIDNRRDQIRYIILNLFCENGEVGGKPASPCDYDQLDWLRHTALDVEPGWTILIITHMFYKIIKKERDWGITSYAQACMDILDTYSGSGTIAAVIQGHTHRDRIASTRTGIPIIISTCDKNQTAESADGFIDILVDRPDGTIREQAFDVMVLNKKARTLTAVRIGCPAMNEETGTETEERTVCY
ncbi:MAG: metallophosphoesterase [Clostridia bacterium]|nr:metallophosphoesterase [Clostridia bacterium]